MRNSNQIYFFLFLLFLTNSCNNRQKQGVESTDQPSTYKIHENKIIKPGAYWYYQLEDGDNKVYEINTEREKVVFECKKEDFDIQNEQLFLANCQIITKDSKHYIPVKGRIHCKKISGKQLSIEMELDGIEAKEGQEINQAYLDSLTQYDCHITFKGKCKRID